MAQVKVKKLDERAVLPTRGSSGAAGYDLYACLDADMTVPAHTTAMIHTGLAVALPEGTFGAVFARSGLAAREGLRPANCVGVIDWDYRGELIVALHNSSENDFVINHGERIAQLVLAPVFTPEVEVVDELSDTDRGAGGFGSTNK